MALRVALFVEGSRPPKHPRRGTPIDQIWQGLARALSLAPFNHIFGISKSNLIAMDPNVPRCSGDGEPLDQLIVRKQRLHAFDAAVVAWDLYPDWHEGGDCCRRRETLDLYRLLADSDTLPTCWRDRARARHADLTARPAAQGRAAPPTGLSVGDILAICMEPMFEDLILPTEPAVRRALGLSRRPNGWPSKAWNNAHSMTPDRALLKPIIESTRRAKCKVSKQVRGGYDQSKDAWGEYILRRLLSHDTDKVLVLEHAISRRMSEWLSPTQTEPHPWPPP